MGEGRKTPSAPASSAAFASRAISAVTKPPHPRDDRDTPLDRLHRRRDQARSSPPRSDRETPRSSRPGRGLPPRSPPATARAPPPCPHPACLRRRTVSASPHSSPEIVLSRCCLSCPVSPCTRRKSVSPACLPQQSGHGTPPVYPQQQTVSNRRAALPGRSWHGLCLTER